jgi:hypothetical protein
MATTKAVMAARKQQEQMRGASDTFDKTKLKTLFESDPVPVSPRFGVLSVQVYQYNDGAPHIGVYRVWVSGKTNEEKIMKELCPLSSYQAQGLASALAQAAEFLSKIEEV